MPEQASVSSNGQRCPVCRHEEHLPEPCLLCGENYTANERFPERVGAKPLRTECRSSLVNAELARLGREA